MEPDTPTAPKMATGLSPSLWAGSLTCGIQNSLEARFSGHEETVADWWCYFIIPTGCPSVAVTTSAWQIVFVPSSTDRRFLWLSVGVAGARTVDFHNSLTPVRPQLFVELGKCPIPAPCCSKRDEHAGGIGEYSDCELQFVLTRYPLPCEYAVPGIRDDEHLDEK